MNYTTRKDILKKIARNVQKDVIFIYTAKGPGKDGCIKDPMERILERVLLTKKKNEALVIIETYGGDYNVALGIMSRLSNAYSKVTVAVYDQAKSVGTFMALAANNILMAQNAQLGPIDIVGSMSLDIQSEAFPIQEVGRFLKEQNSDLEPNGLLDESIYLAGIKMKEEYAEKYIKPIVNNHYNGVYEELVSNGNHYAPIFYQKASQLGLKVELMDSSLEKLLRELIYSVEDEFEELKQLDSAIFLGQHMNLGVKNFETRLALIETPEMGFIEKVKRHVDKETMKVYPVSAGWENEN